MEQKSQELKSTLTGQPFESICNQEVLIDEAKKMASSFALATEGIAVLSDFDHGKCHTYSGKFGQQMFSLEKYTINETSPFEDIIFDGTLKEDLLKRHVLELRFFHFVRTVPENQRTDFQMSCVLRFIKSDGPTLPVVHTSRYIQWDSKGNPWLGLCTYFPLPLIDIKEDNGLISTVTGETVDKQIYIKTDSQILSKRQTEILSLLAKGEGSKQIAAKLNISVHTVNRHRQDILTALKVANTASAVEIGLRLHLI